MKPMNTMPPETWEKPAALCDANPAEPFPLEALPGPMRAMAEAIAGSMPCPPDMPACTMLAAASVAIGNTRRLRVKTSWHEQPRLWIAVVARPGSKKSPAAGAVLTPIRAAQKRLRREYDVALQNHKEKVAEWKEQAEQAANDGKELPDKPKEPTEHQVFTTDCTREALCDMLAENPRGLLIHRDELAGWARSLNQYKAGKGDDKQFWLSLWSGEPVAVNRRGRRVHVDDPFVSVVGNLPPAVLSELGDERGREDGWIHRILFAWPDPIPPAWTDYEPEQQTLDANERVFAKLFALEPDHDADGEPFPRTLKFTADGKAQFIAFVNQLAGELAGDNLADELRGPWSKMEGYCARLALVLHVCRLVCGEAAGDDVDAESVTKAVQIIRYFQAHARRVYPQLLHDKTDGLRQDAEAVVGWVRRNWDRIAPGAGGDGPAVPSFTWRMVRRDLARRFEGREESLRQALEVLEARGYLHQEEGKRAGTTGRRPEALYRVNPDFWVPMKIGALELAGGAKSRAA